MAGANFTGIFRVIMKVPICQNAIFVADQAIGLDLSGIELDLEFHVLGNCDQAAGHLFDEHFLSLPHAVEMMHGGSPSA